MEREGQLFGLSVAELDQAKAELREAILVRARRRQMVAYGEAAAEIEAVPVNPHSALMSHLLGLIFREEHEARRPALTAIVTHKDGDKEPGPGFYDMARKLGISFADPLIYWSTEVQRVFKMYGTSSRVRRSTRDT